MSETRPREDRPTGISENEIQQLKKRADDLEITLGALIKLFIRKEYVSEEESHRWIERALSENRPLTIQHLKRHKRNLRRINARNDESNSKNETGTGSGAY